MRAYSLAFDSRELPSRWVPVQVFLYFATPSTVLISQGVYLSYIATSVFWKLDARRPDGLRYFEPSPGWPPFILPGWIFLLPTVFVVFSVLLMFVGPKDGPINAHPVLMPALWIASAAALVHYARLFDYAEGWPTYVIYFAAVMAVCSIVGFGAAAVRGLRKRAVRRRDGAAEA